MSHDPSTNVGVRAIQIDIDGASVVSDDISIHSKTDFRATGIYFIDHRYFITTSTSTGGMVIYTRLSGFSFMGGITRSNAVSGVNTITDNIFCGVNERNVTLSNVETTSGADPITGVTFRSYWRIS